MSSPCAAVAAAALSLRFQKSRRTRSLTSRKCASRTQHVECPRPSGDAVRVPRPLKFELHEEEHGAAPLDQQAIALCRQSVSTRYVSAMPLQLLRLLRYLLASPIRFLRWLYEKLPWTRRMRNKVSVQDAEIKGLNAALARSKQEAERLVRSLEQTSGRATEWEKQWGRAVRERDELRAHESRLEAQGEALKQQITQLERDLAYTGKKQRETNNLLQRRTTELRDAEAYLTLIDDVADSEVVQIIEQLNGQIFQSAAAISDATEFTYDGPHDTAVWQAARARLELTCFLGADLLASLSSTTLAQNSELVQLALQAGMAEYTQRLGNSWDVNAVGDTTTIGDIYLKIRERGSFLYLVRELGAENGTEPQAVAGRWRILGRTYMKLLREGTEDPTRVLFETLSTMVTDVLLVCGARGSRETVSKVVAREFEGDLQGVLKLALQFHRTAGERVVSCDFVILHAKPGAAFETTSMQDVGVITQSAMPPPPTNVLCTTDLGLLVQKTSGGAKRSQSQPIVVQTAVLVKCKVVMVPDMPQSEHYCWLRPR